MYYPIRTPWLLKQVYRGCTWDLPSAGNRIYLSFDDGPHPEATTFVLDELEKFGARASFFCIGANVLKYPQLYNRILEAGHTTGNHTQHHLNGWKNSDDDYLEDIIEAGRSIRSALFRPPYGRMRFSQLKRIRQQLELQPVMWSLLSGDFDRGISGARCAENVMENMRAGDIVVFHDSEKAMERLRYALPLVLEAIYERGWVAEKL